MRRGLTARRSVKSPPRQLEYFSPRQLRKDRPRRPALEFRQEEEAAASQANMAKSIAFHLHKTPPTYFTEVVAEEALIAERVKQDKLIAEEEARLLLRYELVLLDPLRDQRLLGHDLGEVGWRRLVQVEGNRLGHVGLARRRLLLLPKLQRWPPRTVLAELPRGKVL